MVGKTGSRQKDDSEDYINIVRCGLAVWGWGMGAERRNLGLCVWIDSVYTRH